MSSRQQHLRSYQTLHRWFNRSQLRSGPHTRTGGSNSSRMALVQVGSRPADCQELRKTARGRASRKGRSSFCVQSALSIHRLSGTASKPQVTPPPSSGQIGVSLPFLARPLIGCAPHPSSSSDDQRHFNPLFREGLYRCFIIQMQRKLLLSVFSLPLSLSHQ